MSVELSALSRRFVALPVDKQRSFLEKLRASGIDFDTLPLIPRNAMAPVVPLGYAQRALWLAWRRAPQSPAYNLSGQLAIDQYADNAEEIHACVAALVRRHAVLRTSYPAGPDGQPVQRIDPAHCFGWTVRKWNMPRSDGEQMLAAAAHAFFTAPFDLVNGPVFRGELHVFTAGATELLLGVHHIAADGQSVALLSQELIALLAQPAQAGKTVAPALEYADYTMWQRQWLEAGELQRQIDYWCTQLHEAPLFTALPLDRPRRSVRAAQGGLVAFALEPEVSQRLEALGRQHAASPYIVSIALLALLVHRYCGEEELCIGSATTTRDRPELAGMVGHFTNVLVLRLKPNASAGFTDLLLQVRDRMLEAKSHQDLPLDMLIEALAVKRSAGLHPLFQIKATQLGYGGRQAEESESAAAAAAVEGEVHFDLSFDLIGTGRQLRFSLAYAKDILDRSTVEGMAASLCALAAQAAATPELPLAGVVLPFDSNLRGEPANWLCDSVPQLFERAVARQPEATALVCGDRVYSYAALDRASLHWAAHLRSLGIGPERRVAVCMARSPEFVLALLSVMRAGGAYVPVDATLPQQRIANLLEDCGAAMVLVSSPLAWQPRVPQLAVDFASMTDGSSDVLAPPSVLHTAQAAYVIYTSGSTGRPQGVVVPHGALANYVQGVLSRLALPAGERFAMVSTVAADLGHTSLFGALCSGGGLHLLTSDEAFDPDAFATSMARNGTGVLKIVPSHLKALLYAQRSADVLPLHTLVLGGESTDAAMLQTIRLLRPKLRIFNHYGPTETTVGMLMHPAQADAAAADSLPLGRPIPGVDAWVLDGRLNPVPPGMPGELFVGGVGVARGYLGCSGLCAERFVASPFGEGERLYRTGDLVRLRSDGVLEFLGRGDDQVKIRGYRVDPGELVAHLRQLPGVADAAVMVDVGSHEGAMLRAYVVPTPSTAPLDIAQLRRALQDTLPQWLMPEWIVPLAALPLTPNGKLDRHALPRPLADDNRNVGAAAAAFDAPCGAVEEALADVWRQLLCVDRVARSDNFFALGGDSILSLKMVARIRKQLPGGTQVSLSDVMQATNLGSLAARLRENFESLHDAVCLAPAGDGVPLFCLPGLIVNTREFLPLAQALHGDRPVYGFVSHVYTRKRWRGFSVEALAADYADFIVVTATQGRCALLGWSSGGDLAFEVARRLAGRVEVAFTALVDVFETEPLMPTRELSDAQRAEADQGIAGWLAHSEMADRWQQLLARMNECEKMWVAQQLLDMVGTFPVDGAGDEAAEYLLWAAIDKRVQAVRYTYLTSSIPVHVYQADSSLGLAGVLRDWGQHANVVSAEVLGDAGHLDIIRHPRLCESVKAALRVIDAA